MILKVSQRLAKANHEKMREKILYCQYIISSVNRDRQDKERPHTRACKCKKNIRITP